MDTASQITDFANFAMSQLQAQRKASIDDLYLEWRTEVFRDVDAAAVMASVRDVEAGERGRPVAEFLREFDAARGDAS
ncbi:hypothetical protein [Botrimarina sp.]|uniref:hypothetical protein n=1 Tax=Botrimarina sp. TaxID=2795802 RepID=UPI0032EAAC91